MEESQWRRECTVPTNLAHHAHMTRWRSVARRQQDNRAPRTANRGRTPNRSNEPNRPPCPCSRRRPDNERTKREDKKLRNRPDEDGPKQARQPPRLSSPSGEEHAQRTQAQLPCDVAKDMEPDDMGLGAGALFTGCTNLPHHLDGTNGWLNGGMTANGLEELDERASQRQAASKQHSQALREAGHDHTGDSAQLGEPRREDDGPLDPSQQNQQTPHRRLGGGVAKDRRELGLDPPRLPSDPSEQNGETTDVARDEDDWMEDGLDEPNERRRSPSNADIGNGDRSDRWLDGRVAPNGLKEPDQRGWTPPNPDQDDSNRKDMPSHHHDGMEDGTNEPSQERRASPNPNIGHQERTNRWVDGGVAERALEEHPAWRPLDPNELDERRTDGWVCCCVARRAREDDMRLTNATDAGEPNDEGSDPPASSFPEGP